MERLKKVIEQYGRWSELTIYTDRIDAHVSTDFSHAIENAKALLETIGKEICESKNVELGKNPNFNVVMKQAFIAIGYTADDMVTQISTSLANIGNHMGSLRNKISPTAHGRPLEELKERNNVVDELTREFLIDSTIIVATFLIRAYETENPRKIAKSEELVPVYGNKESFNDFWDDLYGEFEMGDYSYPASEILFNIDYKAYKTELTTFEENE